MYAVHTFNNYNYTDNWGPVSEEYVVPVIVYLFHSRFKKLQRELFLKIDVRHISDNLFGSFCQLWNTHVAQAIITCLEDSRPAHGFKFISLLDIWKSFLEIYVL